VALDACSDYQRHGTLFLSAEDLLEKRRSLQWGAFALPQEMELRYRFTKAAAKNKDTTSIVREFDQYPEEIRRDCQQWVYRRWRVSITSWDETGVSRAISDLRKKVRQRPSLLRPAAIQRIASRILHPTGLVVIVSSPNFDSTATTLGSTLGHLYFRRFRKVRRWRPAMLGDLIASTLIALPELPPLWSRLLPADCVHRMSSENDCRTISRLLHERCKRRMTT
jgi:hypothetical protein